MQPATPTKHRFLEVDGLDTFYREAGDPANPTLLLHGFPTSSQMYRNLIPRLSDRYHLVAPDYPSFGHSTFPRPRTSTTPSSPSMNWFWSSWTSSG